MCWVQKEATTSFDDPLPHDYRVPEGNTAKASGAMVSGRSIWQETLLSTFEIQLLLLATNAQRFCTQLGRGSRIVHHALRIHAHLSLRGLGTIMYFEVVVKYVQQTSTTSHDIAPLSQ